jgi:hypothetical protein
MIQQGGETPNTLYQRIEKQKEKRAPSERQRVKKV